MIFAVPLVTLDVRSIWTSIIGSDFIQPNQMLRKNDHDLKQKQQNNQADTKVSIS